MNDATSVPEATDNRLSTDRDNPTQLAELPSDGHLPWGTPIWANKLDQLFEITISTNEWYLDKSGALAFAEALSAAGAHLRAAIAADAVEVTK